jgi:hypothetical protein
MARTKKEFDELTEHDAASLAERHKKLAERGAVTVGGGLTVEKWEAGKEVEGTFAGIRKGSLGHLVDLTLADSGEVVTYGCPTILKSRLENVRQGQVVNILCTGTTPSKYKTPSWTFDVAVFPD